MILFRYISLSILLLFGGASYSQDLLVPAPLDRFSLSFDGVDEFTNIDNTLTVLSTTTKGTWSCWVKPVTLSNDNRIISFGDTNENEQLWLYIVGSKITANSTKAGFTEFTWVANSIVGEDNVWMHIVFVQDGTELVVYFNGSVLAGGFGVTTNKGSWFADLVGLDNGRLGNRNRNNTGESIHFNGGIDEVSLWNTDLSALQIAEIYNGNKPTNLKGHSQVANLVTWYQMGEFSSYDGANWNIVDASVNSNTGITVNMEESDRVVSTLIYEQPIGMLRVGSNLITSP